MNPGTKIFIKMKKLRFLVIIVLLLANVGIVVAQEEPKNMTVPEGKAVIYIIRLRDIEGMWRSINKIDDTDLPTLGSRNYVYKVVEPGDHKVICKGSTKESVLNVTVEAGKKYYVIQRVSVFTYGVYWTKLALEKDQKRADKYISDCIEAKFKDAK
jgi:hypothetical protein